MRLRKGDLILRVNLCYKLPALALHASAIDTSAFCMPGLPTSQPHGKTKDYRPK